MADDPFAPEPLVTPCTLFNNTKRNTVKALVDTGATGYAFIDEITAHIICENLGINPIPLLRPKPIKGFDGHLAKQPITHAIYPGLTVQDHSKLTTPMLITPLGQHPIILGKPWLNRHGVVLDMKLDSLIFVPGRCSHFGSPKVLEPPKPEPLEKLPVSNSSKEDVPIPKVTKILKRPTNLVNTNRTEESRLREPPKVIKPRDFSIAMIGAAAFQTVTHQKGTQLFSIIMSELDKQLAGSKDDIYINKISEMTEDERKDLRTKVPREFHDFLDVFDRKAAEVLPPN